jgi:hypothetical protein
LRDEELPILVPVDFGDLVPVTEEHSRLLSRHTLPGIVDDLVEVAPIHDDLRAARPRFSTRHHGRMVMVLRRRLAQTEGRLPVLPSLTLATVVEAVGGEGSVR